MAPNVTEKKGAVTVTFTVRGRHASMELEGAEAFLEDLENAIHAARAKKE